jgi:hypothetical protein
MNYSMSFEDTTLCSDFYAWFLQTSIMYLTNKYMSWWGFKWFDFWKETRQTHETGGTGDSVGEGRCASSCARNVSKVMLTRRVTYTRWRRFRGKCNVFCGFQNLNLWLKCHVSTIVCLTKNHHTKIAFVVGIDGWKRRETYWTNSFLEDHPLVTSQWKTFETVLSAVGRNQCINIPEN